MGNVATKLPGTGERQNDCGDPKSSVDERPGARELCRGDRLSVFCDHQQPKYWPEHMDRQAQLFLTFDGADGEITWRRRSGNIVTEPLPAHQYCFVAPACLYALRWRNAADVVLLRLGDRLVEEHLAGPMQGVVVEDFKPLSRLDGCLWSLAEALWETCGRPLSPAASFVEGIGTAPLTAQTAKSPGVDARAILSPNHCMRTNTALSHRHACMHSGGGTRPTLCFSVLEIVLWRSIWPARCRESWSRTLSRLAAWTDAFGRLLRRFGKHADDRFRRPQALSRALGRPWPRGCSSVSSIRVK